MKFFGLLLIVGLLMLALTSCEDPVGWYVGGYSYTVADADWNDTGEVAYVLDCYLIGSGGLPLPVLCYRSGSEAPAKLSEEYYASPFWLTDGRVLSIGRWSIAHVVIDDPQTGDSTLYDYYEYMYFYDWSFAPAEGTLGTLYISVADFRSDPYTRGIYRFDPVAEELNLVTNWDADSIAVSDDGSLLWWCEQLSDGYSYGLLDLNTLEEKNFAPTGGVSQIIDSAPGEEYLLYQNEAGEYALLDVGGVATPLDLPGEGNDPARFDSLGRVIFNQGNDLWAFDPASGESNLVLELDESIPGND